ncbi:hypothetical protein MMPV_003423 [Pyropia vietnamensis]
MNRALLNPFESRDLMGTIEQFLDTEAATDTPDARGTCMAFNRTGNLLAVGTSTGAVIVWDFDTRSVARLLTPTPPAEAARAAAAVARRTRDDGNGGGGGGPDGAAVNSATATPGGGGGLRPPVPPSADPLSEHPPLVTAVAFAAPRDGRHLFSAHADGQVRLWAVGDATTLGLVHVDGVVAAIAAHPRVPGVVAVAVVGAAPVLVAFGVPGGAAGGGGAGVATDPPTLAAGTVPALPPPPPPLPAACLGAWGVTRDGVVVDYTPGGWAPAAPAANVTADDASAAAAPGTAPLRAQLLTVAAETAGPTGACGVGGTSPGWGGRGKRHADVAVAWDRRGELLLRAAVGGVVHLFSLGSGGGVSATGAGEDDAAAAKPDTPTDGRADGEATAGSAKPPLLLEAGAPNGGDTRVVAMDTADDAGGAVAVASDAPSPTPAPPLQQRPSPPRLATHVGTARLPVPLSMGIRSIVFSRKGDSFVAVCGDRYLRVFASAGLDPLRSGRGGAGSRRCGRGGLPSAGRVVAPSLPPLPPPPPGGRASSPVAAGGGEPTSVAPPRAPSLSPVPPSSVSPSPSPFDTPAVTPAVTPAASPAPGGPAAASLPRLPPTVELTPTGTFHDRINRVQFTSATFSFDGDFILASTSDTDHRVLVLRQPAHELERSLAGPRESVAALAQHPRRAVLATLGSSTGGVYVWSRSASENWSAFAPEFTELDENELYEEAEDEFDLRDNVAAGAEAEAARAAAEGGVVDLLTEVPVPWFSDDSEEEEGALSGGNGGAAATAAARRTPFAVPVLLGRDPHLRPLPPTHRYVVATAAAAAASAVAATAAAVWEGAVAAARAADVAARPPPPAELEPLVPTPRSRGGPGGGGGGRPAKGAAAGGRGGRGGAVRPPRSADGARAGEGEAKTARISTAEPTGTAAPPA